MTTTDQVPTFVKLKSDKRGKWGVRCPGARPVPGASLTVHKKDGSASEVMVLSVVWSSEADDLHLCETRDVNPRPKVERTTYTRTNRVWRPCGYPGCTSSYCDECDGRGA